MSDYIVWLSDELLSCKSRYLQEGLVNVGENTVAVGYGNNFGLRIGGKTYLVFINRKILSHGIRCPVAVYIQYIMPLEYMLFKAMIYFFNDSAQK